MRWWTRTTVENLVLSDKERENDNRYRTDYRVFLSRYCTEFRKLNSVQQQNIIGIPNNVDINDGNGNGDSDDDVDDDDNDDDDDDDHITVPPIQYHDIVRAGAFH